MGDLTWQEIEKMCNSILDEAKEYEPMLPNLATEHERAQYIDNTQELRELMAKVKEKADEPDDRVKVECCNKICKLLRKLRAFVDIVKLRQPDYNLNIPPPSKSG